MPRHTSNYRSIVIPQNHVCMAKHSVNDCKLVFCCMALAMAVPVSSVALELQRSSVNDCKLVFCCMALAMAVPVSSVALELQRLSVIDCKLVFCGVTLWATILCAINFSRLWRFFALTSWPIR